MFNNDGYGITVYALYLNAEQERSQLGEWWAFAKIRPYRTRPQLLQLLVEHREEASFQFHCASTPHKQSSASVVVKVAAIRHSWGRSLCVMKIFGTYINLKS